ncbi:MAG: hypothetical protein ACOYMU_10510 [Phycisphaerales bacterium]|jgi:hypothetical protein
MSKMRGVDAFAALWKRRTTIELSDGTRCDLLSLPDLVKAKKTQRDKDWPMIRRLVEAHFFENNQKPNASQISFWLQEMRTSQLLMEIGKRYPAACKKAAARRPLLSLANCWQSEGIGPRTIDRAIRRTRTGSALLVAAEGGIRTIAPKAMMPCREESPRSSWRNTDCAVDLPRFSGH